MILKRLKVISPLGIETNCYIVKDEKTSETMVIDPGGEIDKIIEMLNILEIKELKYIYLTHCHGDHISALSELKKEKGGKVLIHRDDKDGLKNSDINLSEYIGAGVIEIESDIIVDDNDLIHLGDVEFKVIHTPGHTKGSSCLYCEKENLIFSGDTVFRGAWGRTDLPTSDFGSIISSITNKIMTLPDKTVIYPGHGKMTLIKEEEPIYLCLRPRKDI